ncbi:MAG: hypothetical protein H7A33_02305 [Deltaproteobacteria bacterium]|nr:hypothetical protein [Deltaproteobacteria bacterium]
MTLANTTTPFFQLARSAPTSPAIFPDHSNRAPFSEESLRVLDDLGIDVSDPHFDPTFEIRPSSYVKEGLVHNSHRTGGVVLGELCSEVTNSSGLNDHNLDSRGVVFTSATESSFNLGQGVKLGLRVVGDFPKVVGDASANVAAGTFSDMALYDPHHPASMITSAMVLGSVDASDPARAMELDVHSAVAESCNSVLKSALFYWMIGSSVRTAITAGRADDADKEAKRIQKIAIGEAALGTISASARGTHIPRAFAVANGDYLEAVRWRLGFLGIDLTGNLLYFFIGAMMMNHQVKTYLEKSAAHEQRKEELLKMLEKGGEQAVAAAQALSKESEPRIDPKNIRQACFLMGMAVPFVASKAWVIGTGLLLQQYAIDPDAVGSVLEVLPWVGDWFVSFFDHAMASMNLSAGTSLEEINKAFYRWINGGFVMPWQLVVMMAIPTALISSLNVVVESLNIRQAEDLKHLHKIYKNGGDLSFDEIAQLQAVSHKAPNLEDAISRNLFFRRLGVFGASVLGVSTLVMIPPELRPFGIAMVIVGNAIMGSEYFSSLGIGDFFKKMTDKELGPMSRAMFAEAAKNKAISFLGNTYLGGKAFAEGALLFAQKGIDQAKTTLKTRLSSVQAVAQDQEFSQNHGRDEQKFVSDAAELEEENVSNISKQGSWLVNSLRLYQQALGQFMAQMRQDRAKSNDIRRRSQQQV